MDANNDGRKDPYNPVDAICAAARYLKAAGARRTSPRRSSPTTTPTGTSTRCCSTPSSTASSRRPRRLAHRAHRGRPLPSRREGPLRRRHLRADAAKRASEQGRLRQRRRRDQRLPDSPRHQHLLARRRPRRRGQRRRDQEDRPEQEARQVHRPPATPTATSSPTRGLGKIAKLYPVPKQKKLSARTSTSRPARPNEAKVRPEKTASRRPQGGRDLRRARRPADRAARAGRREAGRGGRRRQGGQGRARRAAGQHRGHAAPPLRAARRREGQRRPAPDLGGQLDTLLGKRDARLRDLQGLLRGRPPVRPQDDGHRAAPQGLQGHRRDSARRGRQDRPAGAAPALRDPPGRRGAHRIDPKPILDGWKLLESTAIYRAAGKDPFDTGIDVGQVLLSRRRSCSARYSPTRASRSTPAAARTSAPARSTAAYWRRWSTWSRADTG